MEDKKRELKSKLQYRLKEALSDANMKPIELSEKTGIPKSAISQYMSGYANPKQDRIYLISKALNIDEAWLMGFDVDKKKSTANHALELFQQLDSDQQESIINLMKSMKK